MIKNIFLLFLSITFFANIQSKIVLPEKHITCVITAYNTKKWLIKNLQSVLKQTYRNFHIIFVDDASPDGTGTIVNELIKKYNLSKVITLIQNKERQGKLKNLYTIYHSLNDWDIIVQLDGDDEFAHENIFALLNKIYSDGHTWLTYGQFVNSDGTPGYAKLPSADVITDGTFRKNGWWYMPTRSFYAWLFKAIKKEDLICQKIPPLKGTYYPASDDLAYMYPMVEMACEHIRYIPEITYIRTLDNPLSDRSYENIKQVACRAEILQKEPYKRLDKPKIQNSH